MAFAVLFVLLCLAPFAIVCEEAFAHEWLPETVPLAAQQCIDLGYTGQCVSNSRPLVSPNICTNLRCADGRGEPYFLSPIFKTRDGTKCGDNMVCRGSECVTIMETKVPVYTGQNIMRYC